MFDGTNLTLISEVDQDTYISMTQAMSVTRTQLVKIERAQRATLQKED